MSPIRPLYPSQWTWVGLDDAEPANTPLLVWHFEGGQKRGLGDLDVAELAHALLALLLLLQQFGREASTFYFAMDVSVGAGWPQSKV